MKKFILSGILLISELIIFNGLIILLNIDSTISIKLTLTFVLFLLVFGHYDITSKLIWDEMRSLFKAVLCFYLVSCIFSEFNNIRMMEAMTILSFLMYFVTLILDRLLRIVSRDFLARRTLIIGCGTDAERLGRIANNNRFALTKVLAYIRYNHEEINADLIERYENNEEQDKNFHLYEFEDIERVIEKEHIEQVLLAVPEISKEEVNDLLVRLYNKVKVIKYIPDVNVIITFNSKIQDFDGIILISTAQGNINFIGKIIKRTLDIISALFGLLLLLPLSLYVRHKNRKSGDHDPIFFKQKRIGVNGKPITIYKFRTMIPNAEQVLETLMKEDPALREEYLTNKKILNDPRITKVGEFLRKSSLDEFPQFINVLKGEMSLVGPRPYLFREKEDMDIYYDSIVKCKPGITGMWQANGRSDVGFNERCKLDDYYYKNWTFSLDMIIIYKTVKCVLYGKGAL